MKRIINEIIIHCTATHPSMNVTLDDIEKWHKARGFKGIGYHYVIDRDGRSYNTRPELDIGAHCASRNRTSIGIAYIGGSDDRTGKPTDTRTAKQRNTLQLLIIDICARHDITQIVGHSHYANKDCPCFDALREYYHLLPCMA